MIANKWYCIAQSGTFDSGCIVDVSFDGYSIQFSVGIRYGSSAINITSCNLPSSINLSARLRQTESQWSLDLLSDKDISTNVVVAGSPFWVAVNSEAGAGDIILSLTNISKEFNTEGGGSGSGGGFDEDMLRKFLEDNGYTALLDFWKWEETAGGSIRTKYNIIVEKGGAFGQGSAGGDTPAISNVTIYFNGSSIPYKTNEAGVITLPSYPTALKNPHDLIINGVHYNGSKEININLEGGGGIADSVAWENVLGRPTALSEFENDVPYLTEQKASDTYVTKASLEDMWYIDENGSLHTRYNLVVDGGGAFGQGATPGGGTSGGLGKVTIKTEGGIEYTTNDVGVVVIPNYITASSLNGYATESWVEGKKYLTSVPAEYVTETELTNKGYAVASDIAKTYATKTDLTTTNANLNTVTTGLANLSTKVGTIESNLSGVTERLGSAETTIKSHTTSIANNTANIAVNAGNISTNASNITKVSNRVTELEKYWKIDSNGNLHTTYNIVVDGGGAFGSGTSGGGGASGGIGKVTLKTPSNIAYDSDGNGVVLIPEWSTQFWVESKGYATQAWVNDAYLSKSGGTVIGSGANILTINRTSNNPIIQFQANGTTVGYLGVQVNGYPIYADRNGDAKVLVSEGNYADTTDKRYLQLSGGTISKSSYVPLVIQNTASDLTTVFFKGASGDLGYLGFNGASNPVYMTPSGYAYTLYHTGNFNPANYLPLSGGTISGVLTIGKGGYIVFKDANDTARGVLELTTSQNRFILGYGIANAGYDTSLQGNNIEFTYGTSHSVGMKLTSAGNVSMYGNLTVSGGGAFGSDARYKNILSNTSVDLATIANAPLFTYKWNDREDDKTYLGTTAQYWLDTNFKDAVNTSNLNFYHLDYGALGVGLAITTAREVVKVKTEVEQLREKVNELENELKQYRQWHN